MEQHDVIVVGSGPAGSSCAKALVDAGVDVLVLERDALPRYKTCSGLLFGQTQELLRRYFNAEAPDSVYCQPQLLSADNIVEWKPDGSYVPYYWEIDKDGVEFSHSYQNIWRNLFDKWMLDICGAEYRDRSRVISYEASSDHVDIQVAGANSEAIRNYRCKYLIGADGNVSVVRRGLYPHVQGSSAGILQSYFKIESRGSLRKDSFIVFFLHEVGEVFSCVHEKDGYLVLCVGGLHGRKLRQSMETFRDFLADRFQVRLGEKWRDEGCQMQLGQPVFGKGRVILTGEAAGCIYLNGEGISAAIDSGYRSGKAVAQALNDGGDAVESYAEQCSDIVAHIGKCLEQMHFLTV